MYNVLVGMMTDLRPTLTDRYVGVLVMYVLVGMMVTSCLVINVGTCSFSVYTVRMLLLLLTLAGT